MIDLHCHILPGVDDGARDMHEAVQMAQMAVDGGTRVLACTPHIRPPKYPNSSGSINAAMYELQVQLDARDIPLKLVVGADIHINPQMLDGLRSGQLPTLNGTRYFLFEPPHNVIPPRLERFCKTILDGGYVPVLTHPERLSWIERHYDVICALDQLGVAMQLTAGSVTGVFGKRAADWSHRMLEEDRVDIIASDAHNLDRRSTSLADVKTWLTEHFGQKYALQLLEVNPSNILNNLVLVDRNPGSTKVADHKSVFSRIIDRIVGRRD